MYYTDATILHLFFYFLQYIDIYCCNTIHAHDKNIDILLIAVYCDILQHLLPSKL